MGSRFSRGGDLRVRELRMSLCAYAWFLILFFVHGYPGVFAFALVWLNFFFLVVVPAHRTFAQLTQPPGLSLFTSPPSKSSV